VANKTPSARRDVGRILKQCLETGRSVEIDGLGKFRPLSDGRFEFLAETQPQVFLGYVEEDLASVRELSDELQAAGFNPWLDKQKLLPGQNWPRSIHRAISISDFFVPCFSRRSTYKRGTFQSELRYALDCAVQLPLDEIFIVPVRLEKCELPKRITDQIQYVDLFPDWQKGLKRVVATMRKQVKLRVKRRLLLAG
jgi:hypothetical protein